MQTEAFVWPEFLDAVARSTCTIQMQNAAGFGGKAYLFVPANGGKTLLLMGTDNLAATAGLIYAGRLYQGRYAHTMRLDQPGGPLRLERSEVLLVTITPLTPAE